jgi:hypothetical protein
MRAEIRYLESLAAMLDEQPERLRHFGLPRLCEQLPALACVHVAKLAEREGARGRRADDLLLGDGLRELLRLALRKLPVAVLERLHVVGRAGVAVFARRAAELHVAMEMRRCSLPDAVRWLTGGPEPARRFA